VGVKPVNIYVRGPQPSKATQRQKAKRLARQKARASAKARANALRPVQDKETQHWIDAIVATQRRFEDHAPDTQCWFQIDREADAWPILQAVCDSRPIDLFSIRSKADRCVRCADGSRSHLRQVLQAQPVVGGYTLEVADGPKRTARRAQLQLRVAHVVLEMRDQRTDKRHLLPVNVVWAHEVSSCPRGERGRGIGAYPSRPAARQVMMPHAKCSMAMYVSAFFSHRTRMRRKGSSNCGCVRPPIVALACEPLA
jgi:hypothetical protein